MQILIHQTHHTIGDFDVIFEYLKNSFSIQNQKGLHLFPELFLTGNSLESLPFEKPFMQNYLHFLKDLNNWIQKMTGAQTDLALLMGGLEYDFFQDGTIQSIKKVIYLARPGHTLTVIDKKMIWEHCGFKFFFIENEISVNLPKHDEVFDLIINFNLRPFDIEFSQTKIQDAYKYVKYFGAPLAFVNPVGAADGIIFEGGSFFCECDQSIIQAKCYQSDVLIFNLSKNSINKTTLPATKLTPNGTVNETAKVTGADVLNISRDNWQKAQKILDTITFGLKQYAKTAGFKNFSIALSGGLDSALALTITKLAFTQEIYQEKYNEGLKGENSPEAIKPEDIKIEALFMPSLYTSSESYTLSQALCQNLNIPLSVLPIKFFHSSIKNAFLDNLGTKLQNVADENIQSRLRGLLLYARSNQTNSLVINTSNKSEIAMGYSTMYGDSVGALSILGDLYKSQIFDLAKFINKKYYNIIPEEIIKRAPSAELREAQKDSDSLPPYEDLDIIIETLLNSQFTIQDLKNLAFPRDVIENVLSLYQKSHFKRKQFPPIVKLTGKTFGIDHKVPINQKFQAFLSNDDNK